MTIAGVGLDQGPVYSLGSTLMLMCSVDGRYGPINITWTSTCTGMCFVLQQSSQVLVTKNILHSVDSGNHTCMVVDDVGHIGSSTVEIRVEGINYCLSCVNILH